MPVDWVSAVMRHIHGRPEYHGATYHVTSPYPPLILEMAAVMQEVVEDLSPMGDPDSSWNLDGEWFAKTFRDQLGIYGAYWRDDPQFDMTNTFRAVPHLPCPKLDREMMSQLARFAIDANFGRVRRAKHKPEFDVHRHMRCSASAVRVNWPKTIRGSRTWACRWTVPAAANGSSRFATGGWWPLTTA